MMRLARAGLVATIIGAVGTLAGLTIAQPAPSLRDDLVNAPLSPSLGGDTTRVIESGASFTFLIENAAPGRARVFSFGNRLFNTNWVQAPGSVKSFDGLGPLFNRVSCAACHTFDGRGRPPATVGGPMDSILVRLSLPGTEKTGAPRYHPAYGDQLNDRAIGGVAPEGKATITYTDVPGAYADGTAYTLRQPTVTFSDLAYGPLGEDILASVRVAPQMIGMGLLESVPPQTLEALADPGDADGDGISGRINMVFSAEFGGVVQGRFGWKANVATSRDQTTNAALGDIGITSSVHPGQSCTGPQAACKAAYAQPPEDGPELSDIFLDKLVFYVQAIAVPRQRDETNPTIMRGEVLFRAAGCATCHVPTLKTDANAVIPELANQTFHPFTDLLLHDMGPGLADGRPDYLASGSEWRTPPLWGLGLVPQVNGHDFLLHDGRARGFAEAILWHGGEAEAAKENFRAMPQDDRAALVAFLKSL